MLKSVKALMIATLVALLAACGTYQTTEQSSPGTYLQLVGKPDNVILTVDQKTTTDLNNAKSYDQNGKLITKFAVLPGVHRVTLTRNGKLLVDRKIFVSEGDAFEILIP